MAIRDLNMKGLSCCDVEAGLVNFVFDVAGALTAHVGKDFGKDALELGYPTHFTCSIGLDFKETIVGDVEGGSELMT